MFTAESIYERVRKQPFVPFRIVTSSGETYDVVHPELILVGRRFLEVGVPAKSGSQIADQILRVALLHITAVNDLPVSVAGEINGVA